MFPAYDKKYHLLETNQFTLIKALQYFDEADETDMPLMIHPISWEEMKEFFVKESLRLGRDFIDGNS
jgi:hypothetical protein